MTMPYWGTVLCGLCGTETEFTDILSTHSIGSSDLDTRSPAMHGIVLDAQVQRCPGCGYCSSDVRVAQPEAKAVIARPEYQDQLNDSTYPELATSFLCKAILDRESKNFATATWALICAAWVCDDGDCVELAVECRRKAADLLMLAEEHGQKIAEQDGMSVAILVDLLRRSAQVDRARKIISANRDRITNDLIISFLDYQTELLDKNDFSRHRMSEAQCRPKLKTPVQPDARCIGGSPNDVREDVTDSLSTGSLVECPEPQVLCPTNQPSNTLHTTTTSRSIGSVISQWKMFGEQHIGFIVIIAVVSMAAYLWFDSAQNERRIAEIKRQERVAFETTRVSNSDPLLNLAGCMANNASEISYMGVGNIIFRTDTGKTIRPEDSEEFYEIRNALYERCAATYLQRIQDGHGSFTEGDLNAAFIQVMREEPGVINWINTYRAIHEATKQVLVK